MDSKLHKLMDDSKSKDNTVRKEALSELIRITEKPVSWFNDVREDLSNRLQSSNSFQRSLAMMVLCNLAQSCTPEEFSPIFENIIKLIDDEKFITQRQTIQNLWKISKALPEFSKQIQQALSEKFHSCIKNKHHNLIRLDIIQTMVPIFKISGDGETAKLIDDLLEQEEDQKNRKRYIKESGWPIKAAPA